MDLPITTQNASASFPHYVEHLERKKRKSRKNLALKGVLENHRSASPREPAHLGNLVCDHVINASENLSFQHGVKHEYTDSGHGNLEDTDPIFFTRCLEIRPKHQACPDPDSSRPFPVINIFVKFTNLLIAFFLHLMTGKTCKHLHSSFKCLVLFSFVISYASAFCNMGCQCNDLALKVECKNASLDIVPFLLNPNIKYLKLPCNKITSLGQSLGFYPDLVALDLSYNSLGSINHSDFEFQKSLKVLKLNNNQINLLNNRSFAGMNNINELFLNGNSLSQIQLLSFENLESLLFFDLSNNKLKYIGEDELSPLKNLEVLILSFNKFTSIAHIGFKSLPRLQKFELSGNSISSVPPRAFSHLGRLLYLSLDKNGISSISKTAFEGLPNLISLSLVDNRLGHIPRDALMSLSNLKHLDISGNMFHRIQSLTFRPLVKLEELRVSRCPRLSLIWPNAFHGLDKLKLLDLSYNARLVKVGDSAFTSLHSLNELDLTACGLIFIQPSQMPQGRVTKLHLAGNPLHCNCSLLWLAKIPTNSSFFLDEPTCATPPELYGVGVTKVDLQEAGCETRLGLTAVGICIGVALLGLLVIGLFLVWRWRKREISSAKTLPYNYGSRRGDRIPPRGTLPSLPPHPPYHTPPPYNPKHPFPQPMPFSQYSLHQCHTECQELGSCPYSLHPATRPLLPPPTPSPTSHPFLPSEWLYPSPYEEDTHWYTTIGRDGREYLTGEPKRSNITPSPVHSSASSSFRKPSPATPNIKRNNSTSTTRPSPSLVSSAETPPSPGVPVTYI